MSNSSNNHPSTLLIPESVVWLPYAGLVVMVLSWLGYDFFRFHRKNKLKYARMRETKTVEKEQPSRKRINMISSVGLRFKYEPTNDVRAVGLPVLGDVWNTSPSASDYSTSSHAQKMTHGLSTDITPSDDDDPTLHEYHPNSELSAQEEDNSEKPMDRRRVRSPRFVGSGGGSERPKALSSQASLGFSVHGQGMDNTSSKHYASPSLGRGSHGRNKKVVDKTDDGGGGGGGGRGGGGKGGGRHAVDGGMADYYSDVDKDDDHLDNNVFDEDRVVGDSATQTSFTVADLHYNPGRTGSQLKDPGGGPPSHTHSSHTHSSHTHTHTHSHAGVMNPRVLAISPPKGSAGSVGRESPRSHRSRQGSQSSARQSQSSPRAAKDDQLIVIDFSRSSREDRSPRESSINPSISPHPSARRETKSSAPNTGRRSRDSFDTPDRIDEPVFPGSIRKLPATPDVYKSLGITSSSSPRTAANAAFTKSQSSSKRQPSFSRHATEIESYDTTSARARSQWEEKSKSNETVYQHPQTQKERDRGGGGGGGGGTYSTQNSSPDMRESQKSRVAKSSRSSSSPKSSGDRRHHRKSSESSSRHSSESPQIPSHFYHEDEEGFFSSKSSRDHSGSTHETQQAPRKGIHFFSQLASGRRDSVTGYGSRKHSGGDGGSWHGSGFSGGGFES